MAPPPATPEDAPPRPGLDDRERSLDRRIVRIWRLSAAFWYLFPLGGLTTGAFLLWPGVVAWAAAATTFVLYVLRITWVPTAQFERWHWQLTHLALELRYGLVVRRYEAVPYFRIQQIDITQGPVDRLLGLATLVVTTASASGAATLPGISATDAPDVRAELLARAAEAVAEHPGDLQDAV